MQMHEAFTFWIVNAEGNKGETDVNCTEISEFSQHSNILILYVNDFKFVNSHLLLYAIIL